MQFEIDSLRQRITELETEKAELEAKNSELLKRVIEETAKYKAENVKFKAKIEKLEKNKMGTAELRDRIMMVEQRQMLNESVPLGLPKGNNSSDKDSSNFNFLSSSVIEKKLSEEKDIDKFLDDTHKKNVADNIRRCNKKKKIQHETGIQDVTPDPACTFSESPCEIEDHTQNAIAIDLKVSCDIKTISDQDKSAEQAGLQFITGKHLLSQIDSVKDKTESSMKQSSQNLAFSSIVTKFVQSLLEELLLSDSQLQEPIKFSPPKTLIPELISIKRLANLFCQLVVTRKKTIIAKRTEISSWGHFSERFEDKVKKLRLENKKLTDQTARKQIYNEMKPYLTGNSSGYLRVMTCKARKVNKLFGYKYDPVTLKKIKGIGWHMVQQVTCSTNSISRLTNPQIEYIIEQVKSKTITNQSCVDETFETIVTTSTYDSDDNFSDTSDDTDYFKEEEGANKLIEEGSKKSEVIAKADNDDNVYFYSEDEEEKVTNEEVQKESTAPTPLVHVSAKCLNGNSSDNSKEEAWFDEDTFFNEANPSKVNTVTSDDVNFDEANDANMHDGDSNSSNDE